jgi:hypothetical protein
MPVSVDDLMRIADAERTADEDLANHHFPRDARGALDRARVWAGQDALEQGSAARRRCRRAALAAVGEAVSPELALPPVVRRFGVRRDQAVWASAPVRIDLAGGWQPIFNEDQSIAVILNGEIYNYRELKAELAALGHSFRAGQPHHGGPCPRRSRRAHRRDHRRRFDARRRRIHDRVLSLHRCFDETQHPHQLQCAI